MPGNELLGSDRIDIAFICSGPFAKGRKTHGFVPLAVPMTGESHFYRSYLTVKDEAFQSLADLKGRTFAFTDPESNPGKLMSEQFVEGKLTGGSKFYWQTDTGNAEFCIFVGANPFEANYGHPLRAQKVTEATVDGRMKIAVIDPRCSKTASRAWKWLPVEPVNGVPAIAMAMIQWIIDNRRYDATYLANANKGASRQDKEPTWSQASWLVRINEDGTPGKFLRGSDLGGPTETRSRKDGSSWRFAHFITKCGSAVFYQSQVRLVKI